MREIRQSGSEGGEPHPNAASLPLSCGICRWAMVLTSLESGIPTRSGKCISSQRKLNLAR
jgi:hypothetical protein